MTPQSNAGVAYDAAGTSYLVTQGTNNIQSGYFVLTGTNGILSTPVPIVVSNYDVFRSYAHLSVDPRPQAQNVYTFWVYTDNIGDGYHGVKLSYSHDKGQTWSSDVQVSDEGNEISLAPSSAVALRWDCIRGFLATAHFLP